MKKTATYREPDNYIPKSVRKQFGLGEYNTDVYVEKAKTNKSTSTKAKTSKKSK